MPEFTLRFSTDAAPPDSPEDAAAALQRLRDGNRLFSSLFDVEAAQIVEPIHIGVDPAGRALPQRPFAAVLGCADARVPVEFVFHLASNNLFVVRVAGNVPGNECIGSFEYAEANLKTVRLAVVLGHTGCGAVTAAVDAYLDHRSYPATGTLRSIIDRILPAVMTSARALRQRWGAEIEEAPAYRQELIDQAITTNAALSAMTLGDAISLPTAYGVFDLGSRKAALDETPADPEAFLALALELAGKRPGAGGAVR